MRLMQYSFAASQENSILCFNKETNIYLLKIIFACKCGYIKNVGTAVLSSCLLYCTNRVRCIWDPQNKIILEMCLSHDCHFPSNDVLLFHLGLLQFFQSFNWHFWGLTRACIIKIAFSWLTLGEAWRLVKPVSRLVAPSVRLMSHSLAV